VGYDAPTIIDDKCTECGKCIRYCPMGAIQFVEE
jgi:ferredoxin